MENLDLDVVYPRPQTVEYGDPYDERPFLQHESQGMGYVSLYCHQE